MRGVPEQFEHATDVAEFAPVPHLTGVELYRARIVRHAFEPHTHDGFGLGAIESGVERFRYAGAEHLAAPGALVTMNPGEPHTGRAETQEGWRYHMLYVEPHTWAELAGGSGHWFPEAVRHHSGRAQRVAGLLRALWQADEPLAFDSLLAELVAAFVPDMRLGRPEGRTAAVRLAPVLDYMQEHHDQRLTLDDLAAVAGLSPFHFLRVFRAQHGVTPQQMLMACRLAQAKRLLDRGEPPAEVAAATGLTDQAHLTRAFRLRYGVTPARYQQQMGVRQR